MITVFIPTYNRLLNLKRSVASVLEELRTPIKLSIFDNASTDGTFEYVRELMSNDARVTYYRHSENVGASQNFIKAIDSIETEYFVPLADDDWLLPDFLHKAHNISETYKDVIATIFFAENRNVAGELIGYYPRECFKVKTGYLKPDDCIINMAKFGHFHWSSILFRSKAKKFMGYPYLHVGYPSDVDFQLQCFSNFPVYISESVGSVFFSHDNQESNKLDINQIPNFAEMFRRLDKTIMTNQLFARDDYHELRNMFSDQYKHSWRRQSCSNNDNIEKLKSYADDAVFLGDYRLAIRLGLRCWEQNV